MFIKSKIQFFESKSQQRSPCKLSLWSCLSSQRYNFLKANHNGLNINLYSGEVVYQVKDTIFWKQITTRLHYICFVYELFIKSKIQFFESKSQQVRERLFSPVRCLSSQRYNFLKANHNCKMDHQLHQKLFIKSKIQFFESKSQLDQLPALFFQVVYQVKDTIFWKQITTPFTTLLKSEPLFIKSKIQFFESKSQHYCSSFFMCCSCLSSQRYNFLKANHNW